MPALPRGRARQGRGEGRLPGGAQGARRRQAREDGGQVSRLHPRGLRPDDDDDGDDDDNDGDDDDGDGDDVVDGDDDDDVGAELGNFGIY